MLDRIAVSDTGSGQIDKIVHKKPPSFSQGLTFVFNPNGCFQIDHLVKELRRMKCPTLDPWFLDNLRCPRDKTVVRPDGETLVCRHNHVYPVVNGIPVMLLTDVAQTHEGIAGRTFEIVRKGGLVEPGIENGEIDPYVNEMIAHTNSTLYTKAVNRLRSYPIPDIPLPPAEGNSFLDIGCGWGRWCFAAARIGYQPVGIDPDIKSVLAARRVAKQIGIDAKFVVADARYIPFRDDMFDTAFSYSVLIHFAKNDVTQVACELRRILADGGVSAQHLLNCYGLRSLYVQAKRGFREARNFETRYWTPKEMIATFSEQLGPTEVEVDRFFVQGREPDRHLFSPVNKVVFDISTLLTYASRLIPPLRFFADNVFVVSRVRDKLCSA